MLAVARAGGHGGCCMERPLRGLACLAFTLVALYLMSGSSLGRNARHRCGRLRDHVVFGRGPRNRIRLGHGSDLHRRHTRIELLRDIDTRLDPRLGVRSFPFLGDRPVRKNRVGFGVAPLTRDQIHRTGDAKDLFQPPLPPLVHGESAAALALADG